MRKVNTLLCSLLITSQGFAFANQGAQALGQLKDVAGNKPALLTAPVANDNAATKAPAWEDATLETTGLPPAEQGFWEGVEEPANLSDFCRWMSIPLTYDYTSVNGVIGGSAKRSFSSHMDGTLTLVDEIGLSLGYNYEKPIELPEKIGNALEDISPELSITAGVSLKGNAMVVRPLPGKKSCHELANMFDLPGFKKDYPYKTVLPFQAHRFAEMKVGEIWKLPVTFWMGIKPALSAGYSNVALEITLGAEKEVTPSVSLQRLAEDDLRLRLRLDQARIYSAGAEVKVTITPVEDLFAKGAKLIYDLIGPTLGEIAVDQIMPDIEKYTYASIGADIEAEKGKKIIMQFNLNPQDAAQMQKLEELLTTGHLATIKEIAKLAVKTAFLSDKEADQADAQLALATQNSEAKLGTKATYAGISKIKELATSYGFHIPLIRDYKKTYGKGHQEIHTPGSKETLHVYENFIERTGGTFDIPFQGNTFQHNYTKAAAVFVNQDGGKVADPVLKFEHFKGEIFHTKDSARRGLKEINSVMSYAGAKGGPLKPEASLPISALQIPAPQKAGRFNDSSYMTFGMVVNEKGVQDIINAPEELVIKAYINTLGASEKRIMRKQYNVNGSINMTPVGNAIVVKHQFSKAQDIIKDLKELQICAKPGDENCSYNKFEQAEKLAAMINRGEESEMKYEEILQILVQLTDLENIQAEVAYYEASGGKPTVAKAKEFNADNPSFENANAYDEAVENFEAPAINTD